MFKLLFYIALTFALGLAALWFSDIPGEVRATWQGYEIRTTTAVIVFTIIFIIAALSAFFPMLFAVIRAPQVWWKSRQQKKYKRGLELVTQTLTAIATGDSAAASTLVSKTARTLPGNPISLLLEAQLAGMRRDEKQLRLTFEAMMQHPETKALASRSLAEWHIRKGDLIPAITHAEQALKLDPSDTQALRTTLALYIKSGDLAHAHEMVTNSRRRTQLTRQESNHYHSIILLLRSDKALQENNENLARQHIVNAYRLEPHFLPLVIRYVNLMQSDSDKQAAIKALQRAWKYRPVPELVPLIAGLPLESKKLQAVGKKILLSAPRNNVAAKLLEAKLAMLRSEFALARRTLLEALNESKSKPIYVMLSSLELTERNDARAANAWLEKMQHAESESGWQCDACHHRADEWQAVCASCGGFDTVNYRVAALP